ncbi:acetolactate synthase, small subunit [Alkaliphilus metalliredigens QYMF]|uniref:Acetolactate synthase small subunit n=1 Tax=Alkaliphilus metalliredigens (strain QYMF) TaxID=293826 RepID=A6TTL3_ALKMQ|nr:acetolactate synthase small subunit [Alkaliphilus metalliredigens]ABR49531.1 acetolactate synthase, small subunit [Alkaliphilus metalliredigens QYMF]
MERHVVSILVEKHDGVLNRVAGLFSKRGYHIDSFSFGETENPELSRMTVVFTGDHQFFDQITKQLSKLVDVRQIEELKHEESDYREMVLIKIKAEEKDRTSILEQLEAYKGKIISVATEYLTVEMTGDQQKVDTFIDLMTKHGIKEMARTGVMALGHVN